MISKVPSNGNYLTALWDPGANISLITHDSARRLNLKGRDVTLSVTKVGNTTDYIQSKEYIVPLTDLNGQEWKIRTYGMDQITADVTRVDIRGIAKLFKSVTEKDVIRPEGKVDILIGSDCCVLLPTKAEQKCPIIFYPCAFKEKKSLGTQCNPKCGNCKCGKCPIGNGNYTIAEERELNMIRKGLQYDKDEKRWTVTYPWIRESAELPNNIGAANHRLESTEKRLQRTGTIYANAYNDQIKDMVNRNVARKLSDYEVRNYEGPIHYLPHHEVLKPDSKSTPIRIVFNSSSTYMGHVINDYWAKGSNVLNDMLVVLLRFRQNRIGIAGDISKMYNAIKLSVPDQHTHRFLWRDLDASRKPDHYVLKTVTFGDRPSGTMATVALGMTAEMSKDIYPEAAEMILRNSYVDDIINSVDNNDQARKVMEDTEKLLAKGGFTIKHWIVTGKQSDQWNGLHISNEPKEKILGMIWQPRDDMFTFQAKINFSSKRRGIHIDKDLQQTQIDDIPLILTRRMVLSQVASIYDPLGLACPFVLTAKLLLRSFCKTDGGNGGWDEPIADAMRQKLIEFFKGVFQLESIQFPRCIKPEAAYKNPVFVVFSDGSSVAYGACAYIRWQIGPETYEANLIIAKNRIAPTKQLSIPRLELCGAVIASRIREKIVKEMDFNCIRIIHVVDSTIVRAQIQRESYGFGTFVATRIAEIQSKTEPSDWWWVQGEQNPADLTTRATDPTALVMESVWQKGPDFLRLPIEQWPIRQDYSESSQLPDAVGITMSFEHEEKSRDIVPDVSGIDLNRFSNVSKMLRVTSIILDIAKHRSFKGAANRISAGNIQRAEMIWIKHIQKSLPKDSLVRYRRLGVQTNSDGIITVGQRMQEWMKRTWNQTEFILLPNSHPFIKLIVASFHSEDHSGVDTTLAKLRSRYWIPGVRRIIKLVKKRCIICRKREKKIVGQQMGMLPIERLQPAPAFYYCAVDLFGPFMIRDTVKKRTHGKAYGVLFNCVTTRAVYVDLAEGYDTSSFIMTLRRFVTVRGYPRKRISDSGSQLVAAGKELQQVVHKWDWEPIKSFGKCKGMDWVTTKSADAPWENGVSESLVKSVKKEFGGCHRNIGDDVF
ncbi:uncharacterized protein [Mytilus edulis]|uniref:uncharacterized protein n=1 Tax=Mytilus edulis TaxID=6550 RepID=UPI0039F0AA9C